MACELPHCCADDVALAIRDLTEELRKSRRVLYRMACILGDCVQPEYSPEERARVVKELAAVDVP